jgi:hypothetical protein
MGTTLLKFMNGGASLPLLPSPEIDGVHRRNDKWFLFDDETVTPVTDLTAPDRTEEEETSPKKPKFKPKAKNGFTRDSNGDM